MTRVYFHSEFLQSYTVDPAAAPGRLDPSLAVLKKRYALIEPAPARIADLLAVHSREHLSRISTEELLYRTALLAAGAVIEAAEGSLEGEFTFALCRPPGHHASAESCWGFCYLNNVAVAVQKLLGAGRINSALIIDFDLHFGDGTDNIFRGQQNVRYWYSREGSRRQYLAELESCLAKATADIVAVSAGFDRHADDWGGMLTTDDYRAIGAMLGSFAREKCGGRLFAALEGGYNARSLAGGITAFLEGLEQSAE